MVNSANFSIISKKIDTDISKKVDYIDVILEMTDFAGRVYFSDVMLQGGGVATAWVGHVSEIKWSFDNA